MLSRLTTKFKKYFNKNNVNIKLDPSTIVAKHVYISHDSKIGRYCYINEYARLTKVKVGNFVSIGNNVAIGQGEHDISKLSTSTRFINNSYEDLTQKDCVVESDSWLGSYSFIKRGVRVGYGSVIGTHAVVTKDVPNFAIVVGVPAKVIGYRFEKEVIKKLLEISWWNWDDDLISKYKTLFDGKVCLNKLKDFF